MLHCSYLLLIYHSMSLFDDIVAGVNTGSTPPPPPPPPVPTPPPTDPQAISFPQDTVVIQDMTPVYTPIETPVISPSLSDNSSPVNIDILEIHSTPEAVTPDPITSAVMNTHENPGIFSMNLDSSPTPSDTSILSLDSSQTPPETPSLDLGSSGIGEEMSRETSSENEEISAPLDTTAVIRDSITQLDSVIEQIDQATDAKLHEAEAFHQKKEEYDELERKAYEAAEKMESEKAKAEKVKKVLESEFSETPVSDK